MMTEGTTRISSVHSSSHAFPSFCVGLSREAAIRLSKAFGSSPETWLGLQMAYHLGERVRVYVR